MFTSQPSQMDRLLSANEVKAIIGKRHSWLYEAIKSGAFPKPRKIGRRNSWPASEVYEWMAALPRAA